MEKIVKRFGAGGAHIILPVSWVGKKVVVKKIED